MGQLGAGRVGGTLPLGVLSVVLSVWTAGSKPGRQDPWAFQQACPDSRSREPRPPVRARRDLQGWLLSLAIDHTLQGTRENRMGSLSWEPQQGDPKGPETL